MCFELRLNYVWWLYLVWIVVVCVEGYFVSVSFKRLRVVGFLWFWFVF